jgi:hypothetical protein
MDQVAALMPSKIEEAVKGTPICEVARVVDPLRIEAFLAFLLTKEVADMWNGDQRLNLQSHQIPTIARTLMETFKTENLADFTICFRRGVMGFYQDDRDKLLRIDGAVIVGWMRKYLEEKYQVIENNLMKEKDTPFNQIKARPNDQVNPERNLLALLKTVVGPINAKSQSNDKENEYQRFKLESERRELSDDHLMKILKQEFPTATEEEIKQVINTRRK